MTFDLTSFFPHEVISALPAASWLSTNCHREECSLLQVEVRRSLATDLESVLLPPSQIQPLLYIRVPSQIQPLLYIRVGAFTDTASPIQTGAFTDTASPIQTDSARLGWHDDSSQGRHNLLPYGHTIYKHNVLRVHTNMKTMPEVCCITEILSTGIYRCVLILDVPTVGLQAPPAL